MAKVELLPSLGMFVLSQANGVIGWYSIKKCELISYMNQESWTPVLAVSMKKLLAQEYEIAKEKNDIDS